MKPKLARATRTTLVIILAALLCGCIPEGRDINADPDAGTIHDQYDTLLNRPNIDEAMDKYLQLLDEVKITLTNHFDLPNWEPYDDAPFDESACGFDFPEVRGDQGVTRTIDGGFARGIIDKIH